MPAAKKPAVKAEPTTLAAKILAVMDMVTYVQKDGQNAHERYSYVSEMAVLEAVRGPMAAVGLVVFPPSVVSMEVVKEGMKSPCAVIQYDVTIGHVDGPEEKTIRILGGANLAASREKFAYVSQTGAMKYFLTKLFLLPTGDAEPEDDKHSEQPETEALARSIYNRLAACETLEKFEELVRKAEAPMAAIKEDRPGIHAALSKGIAELRGKFKQSRTAGIAARVSQKADEPPQVEVYIPEGEDHGE
jgi:hypothetical protein